MQQTSATYKSLLAMVGTRKMSRISVAGTIYGEESIVDLYTVSNLFAEDTMSVGGAAAAEIDVTLRAPGDIPRAAQLIPSYRLVNGEQTSEWIQKGVFHVDSRTVDPDSNTVTLHGFDQMINAEFVWVPDQSLVFPMTAQAAVEEIARLMGVPLDPRNQYNATYMVDYPPSNYTGRMVLGYIAAAHARNFVMTDLGALRLVSYTEIPPETNYLVDESGDAITFGGVRILV